MTKPLAPPTPRDPLRPLKQAHVPPGMRSRAATALAARAAQGRFALQTCRDCNSVSYPPRDFCPHCWGELSWQDVASGGEVLATTTVRSSTHLYYRAHLPWRMGTIKLDVGPTCFAHLHGDIAPGDRVRMTLKLDRAGNAALFAMPDKGAANMNDDALLREFTASPKNRRILITDGCQPLGQAVAKAFLKTGARTVYLGNSRMLSFFHGRDEMEALDKVEIQPLDPEDTASVKKLAAQLGGQVDIIVNTATYNRSGSVMGSHLHDMQTAMNINVMGLARLAAAFGPALASRAADGVYSAAAFVDVASVYGLTGTSGQAAAAASSAARWSLLNTLRGELAESGIRVMSVLTGPVEDDWHQSIAPPKVDVERIAGTIISALEEGRELSVVGEVAQSVVARWTADPLLAIREENR